MRIMLLIVAGLALVAFVVVAVVLPQMESTETREAAQALITGAGLAEQQVAAAAEKAGNMVGSGKGVKLASQSDSKHGELKWVVEDNGEIRGWNEKNALEITLT